MASQFILASQSPRRRELLAIAGYRFQCVVPAVTEITADCLSLKELTLANATRKGIAVSSGQPGNVLVVAADTLVGLNGNVFGKPDSREGARRMLQWLSGKTHQVGTAVWIGYGRERFITLTVWSSVRLRRLGPGAIEKYHETIDPLDKAGAYAAQDRAGKIILSIAGSISNVIGLPIDQTVAALATFGIEPFKEY